ncbi:hypothetical protein QBC35DRAFT_534709 [Podospora australis]|uniref:Uncharacterized protein n=1 Tax=Podospora australis TaxID=1536484 RepID=A0AAN6WMI2_9PEZI|nr:hypothetical protein QBC35DRAFT_534709 [Podospora australis]
MKFFLLPTLLAALAMGSPIANPEAEVSPLFEKRAAIGSLKAWTGAGSTQCSGTPGFTWPNPVNNKCHHFVGSNGAIKTVNRLQWSGNNCYMYAYSEPGCTNGEVRHGGGTNICWALGVKSFKVVC